jgi:hypothetical protein
MLKKDTEIEKEALFNLLNLEKLPEKQLKSVSKSLTNIPTQKKTHKLKSLPISPLTLQYPNPSS